MRLWTVAVALLRWWLPVLLLLLRVLGLLRLLGLLRVLGLLSVLGLLTVRGLVHRNMVRPAWAFRIAYIKTA